MQRSKNSNDVPSLVGPPSDVTLDASSRRPSYGFGDLDGPGNLDGPADATHQAQKSSDFAPVFSVDGGGYDRVNKIIPP